MLDINVSMEATCDLPENIIKENDLKVFAMDFMIDGDIYSTNKDNVVSTNLYEKMKEGKKTSTSQINAEIYESYFTNLVKENKPIIHLALSSGLSNTYNCALKAAEKINKTYSPKIYVIDSLCVCSAQGFLGILTKEFIKTANSIEEVVNYVNDLKLRMNHIFTVDNLKYLANGGRIKNSTAIIGNILNIKPVMKADERGSLVAVSKVISRKKALIAIVDKMGENIKPNEELCYISHADCLNEAIFVSNLIKTKLGVKSVITNLGPVIGCHAGPGTIALFFIGKDQKRA